MPPSALGKGTDKGAPLVNPLSSASPAGTRQRESLCRLPPNTLGKRTGKGTHKELLCRVSDTQQRLTLCRVSDTKQRVSLCRVSLDGHSAQAPSPSPGAVTATFLCRVPSDTRQSLCQLSNKNNRQRIVADVQFAELFFLPSVFQVRQSSCFR